VILIEAIAATDAAGSTETLRLSDGPFVTSPADSPANAAFHAALIDPGRIGHSAYSDGRTGGATRLEAGEILVTNPDGRFDAWLERSFDGRPVTIREGAPGGAYPGDYPIIFRGTIDAASGDLARLALRLRDGLQVFETPHLTAKFAGDNVLPEGLQGTAEDIKGRIIPRIYGRVLNAPGVCVNTSKLTFKVNDGPASIQAVYDQGQARVFDQDYATAAALQAAVLTPEEAKYSTCVAAGLFRLHDAAFGEVTVDCAVGATSADRTIAQVMKRIAVAAGHPAAAVSAEDVAALDAAFPAEVGLLVDSEAPTLSLLDQVAASGGVQYRIDQEGVFRLGRLTPPTGTPVVTLGARQILKLARRPARDRARPTWSTSVRYGRNWTVQASGLAGAVAADRRAFLAEAFRTTAPAEDAGVKAMWLQAEAFTVETLLLSAADAATERDRLQAMHRAPRAFFDVTVKSKLIARFGLQLLDLVGLQLPRFSLDAGKVFRLVGIRHELAKGQTLLTVWG
jgi:hypothetical protein